MHTISCVNKAFKRRSNFQTRPNDVGGQCEWVVISTHAGRRGGGRAAATDTKSFVINPLLSDLAYRSTPAGWGIDESMKRGRGERDCGIIICREEIAHHQHQDVSLHNEPCFLTLTSLFLFYFNTLYGERPEEGHQESDYSFRI